MISPPHFPTAAFHHAVHRLALGALKHHRPACHKPNLTLTFAHPFFPIFQYNIAPKCSIVIPRHQFLHRSALFIRHQLHGSYQMYKVQKDVA